ncbi:methyl-accepting chemotaxis protein [Pseudobutyrivibrio sp. 49]|uniref:methyl-accepting chemotaxis protein n=1 Tax=Pseudobutyrivibrio sp. 49 TaxID=1855344 RepID=UPI000891ADFD|nr:methyl-accepting chemotaxis protein [Pseudobutyrivibrio sp. 49]SDH91378.1 methyl-accepting chemotaxis protein [Pseudobutyrivibrio sp. 49]
MKKNKRTTVRRRITRHVVIAIAITITVMTIVNLIYLSRRIIEQQEMKLELATQMSAGEVQNWIKDMSTVTEDMASSLTALGDLNEVTVRAVVDRVALNHPELYYVYFSDRLGNATMARGVQFAEGVDPRERVWYKTAEALGHTVVIDPYSSASRPDVMMVTVATPVYWGTMLVGVVAVDADIATVQDFINSIDFENGSYGFLLDSKNNIIAHPNADFNPKNGNITSAVDVMPELDDILSTSKQDKYITAPDYTGKRMVYSAQTLEGSRWTVAVAYPESNFLSHVDRGIRISLFVAILCAILAVGDITVTVRRVLKPLGKINPAMQKIVEGDFSTKLNFAEANDEIGDLQDELAIVLEALSKVIDKQAYVLSEMENGNLIVEDIENFPGELNQIAKSVNSIKETFNDIISDIQFSAINLQSYAMGINETTDMDEMRMIFEELSAEANALMDKTSKFITMPGGPKTTDYDSTGAYSSQNDYRDDF